MENKKIVRYLAIFVAVVLVSGWLGVLVDSIITDQPEGDSLGMAVWLLLPNLALVAILLLSRTRLSEVGFKLNQKSNLRWYLASIFIYPLVTSIVLLVGAAFHWIDLSALNPKLFFAAFVGTLLANFIKNIFEETLWRGFLTSRLVKLNIKDWMLYLIVGGVWGTWHLAYYLVFLSEADMQMVLPVGRGLFALVSIFTMICWSMMYVELYRMTESIWPCVLCHAVEDSFVNPLVISGFVSISRGKEILVSPIQGLLGSMLYIAVGLGIRFYRKRKEQLATQTDTMIPINV
jgi:hypothetical protein